MRKNLFAPTLRLHGNYRRAFELISFSKNDEGNCAVIHFLDENDPTPWVAVRNLTAVDLSESFVVYDWDSGFYYETRRHAERKFYEMVGVLVVKDAYVTEKPVSMECSLVSFDRFKEEVDDGCITAKDGYGYYSDGIVEYSLPVDLDNLKPNYSYICWYEK